MIIIVKNEIFCFLFLRYQPLLEPFIIADISNHCRGYKKETVASTKMHYCTLDDIHVTFVMKSRKTYYGNFNDP